MLVKFLFHTALYDVHTLNILGKKNPGFRNGLYNLENVLFSTLSAIHMSIKLVTYQGICREKELSYQIFWKLTSGRVSIEVSQTFNSLSAYTNLKMYNILERGKASPFFVFPW